MEFQTTTFIDFQQQELNLSQTYTKI